MRNCDLCKSVLRRNHGVAYTIIKNDAQEVDQDFCVDCDPDYLHIGPQAEAHILDALPNLPSGPSATMPVTGQTLDEVLSDAGVDNLHKMAEPLNPVRPTELRSLLLSFWGLQMDDELNTQSLFQLWSRHAPGPWIVPTIEHFDGLIGACEYFDLEKGIAGPFLSLCTLHGLLPADTSLI
jgi:hypothetical protein